LRSELGIPENATVFGRYGGYDQFDIPFVLEAVESISASHRHIVFLFMNTPQFCCDQSSNVLFLPPTGSMDRRAAFIRTCDAMLHARRTGETFGLAVGEFSMLNRPVLTFGSSQDQSHLAILNENVLIYSDKHSLITTILRFNRTEAKTRDWNSYRRFAKNPVMERFLDVFW
jgi:hypothetical protein